MMAGVPALVGAQAVADQSRVGFEFARLFVAVGTTLHGIAQPRAQLREKHPVRHAIVARRGHRARAGHQRVVVLDALGERRRYVDAAGALRQLLRQVLALLEVGIEDDAVLALEGFADGLAIDVRIAIHVAADPGAEADDAWQFQRLGVNAVQLLERLGDLLVEIRHHPIQHLAQVEQHVLTFIGHGQAFARMILGLPGGGDFRAHAIPHGARFGRGQGRIEPIQQQLCHALLLAQHGASGRLGGMRGEHRLDLQLRQNGRACYPASTPRPSEPRVRPRCHRAAAARCL